MRNDNQMDLALSMKNAEASVRMEGYDVTGEMRQLCERVLRGETTLAECLKRLSKSTGRA